MEGDAAVCPVVGCGWDERGTNHGAGPAACGGRGPVVAGCLVEAALEAELGVVG